MAIRAAEVEERMQPIYVTEDDESIRELIKMALINFSYEVKTFETAEETIAACDSCLPSLFIFDIMLPHMTGLSAVTLLRSRHDTKETPIMLLTAKDTELDKVIGLDAGADDYVTKPFGIMELGARVRALLRRSSKESTLLTSTDITLQADTREVCKGGQRIALSFKEFELLYVLMKHMDRVVPRDELLGTVWGYDYIGETRTLDAHIKSLRQKLGDDADNPIYIKTFRSVGYRFCEVKA